MRCHHLTRIGNTFINNRMCSSFDAVGHAIMFYPSINNAYVLPCYFITGTVMAIQDVWIVGDEFLRDTFSTLVNMRNQATLKRQHPPYLYEFYNIFGYFQNKQSAVRGLARFANSFIEALNARVKLPRYVMFILDRDFIIHTAQADCDF